MKYDIVWHHIDDNGYHRSQVMESFDSLDDAHKVLRTYIRLTCWGWYDIQEVSDTLSEL